MTGRRQPKAKARDVATFPPIPRLPKGPQLPADPRQSGSSHIISTIANVARAGMLVSGPNLSTGFHASAVDVGRIQATLEHGLRRFDDDQVEQRWEEIFDWIRRVLRAWVQRCKSMRIERRQTGIRIELETQDDLGYYEYGFDVLPRRRNKVG